MTVTDIRRTKKGRYSLYVDGEFLFAIHSDILVTCGLSVGGETDAPRLEEIRRESERRSAVEKAARILGHSANTTRQLYDKLCRTVDEDAAAAAVERMEELGLMDDEDYARRRAADLVNLRCCGHRRIVDELRRKGVDEGIIERTLDSMDDDPRARIAALVERKYAAAMGDEAGRRRATNALIRLGYDYGDIRAVLREYGSGSGGGWNEE